MSQIKIILLINFLILQLIWYFTSGYSLRDYFNNLKKIRTVFIWSFGLLLYLQIFGILSYSFSPLGRSSYLSYFGLLLNSTGLILCLWAKITMSKNWGPPAQHDLKKQKDLVTDGPYSYSRNPIYLGLMLIFTGFQLALNSLLFFLIIPLFFLIRKAVLIEEQLLEDFFKKEYLDYKKNVPRFI